MNIDQTGSPSNKKKHRVDMSIIFAWITPGKHLHNYMEKHHLKNG